MSQPGVAGGAHVLMVVEDDADLRELVRLHFSLDPDFSLDGQAVTVDDAVESARANTPHLIVLDHQLEGDATGLEGAPRLREAAPEAKIILFTASEQLRVPAADSPHVDAFLLKTHIDRLVPLARRLLGLSPAS